MLQTSPGRVSSLSVMSICVWLGAYLFAILVWYHGHRLSIVFAGAMLAAFGLTAPVSVVCSLENAAIGFIDVAPVAYVILPGVVKFVAVSVVVYTVRAAWRGKPTFWQPGLCRSCGYSLRDLPSEVCPECGKPFEPIEKCARSDEYGVC